MKVSGIIQAVGTQFNGSLKVDGKFYNFPKKYSGSKDFKVGQMVTIQLKQWEFGGKSGWNIGSVDVLAVPEEAVAPVVTKAVVKEEVAPMLIVPTAPKGRDFDKEARGKTLCQYIQAQLSNPSVDVNDTDAILERAKMLVEKTFE